MRDKRTHRNYARNSLNLTFLLRYTGPACSEVTNFIGKRPIYRSPRSHTISAPPRARRVYTERPRMRMRASTPIRFTPIRTADLAGSRSFDDGSFPNRFTISNFIPPRQRGNKCRGSLASPIADITRGARVWDRHPRYLRIWNFIVEGNIRIVISNVEERKRGEYEIR